MKALILKRQRIFIFSLSFILSCESPKALLRNLWMPVLGWISKLFRIMICSFILRINITKELHDVSLCLLFQGNQDFLSFYFCEL